MLHTYASLVRDERPALLFGVGSAFLSFPGQTFFISLFVAAIGADLGLSAAQLGTLYLLATLGAASLLPLAGHWIDRLDLRLYALLVATGLGLACFVIAGAVGPIGLAFGFMLLRLTGQGLMTHTAVTSVARYFNASRGRALSLVALGFPLAEAATPAAAVALMAFLGWRAGYAVVGAVVLLAAAPTLLRLIWHKPAFTRPGGQDRPGQRPRALDGLKIVVRTGFFWRALPILVFLPFTATALIFHIQAIAAAKGWSSELVALGFTLYALGHATGLLLSGGPVDRFGARNLLPLMNLPALIGIACLGLVDASTGLLVFLGLMGLSSGIGQTSVAAVWAEVYGVAQLGTIRSFATMLMVAGTALGPATVGLMLDSGLSVAETTGILIAFGGAGSLLAAVRRGRGAVALPR